MHSTGDQEGESVGGSDHCEHAHDEQGVTRAEEPGRRRSVVLAATGMAVVSVLVWRPAGLPRRIDGDTAGNGSNYDDEVGAQGINAHCQGYPR